MRGVVTVLGHSRPDLLHRTLVYLARCPEVADYTVIGYTHGPEHRAVLDIFRQMQVGARHYCVVGPDPGPIWPYARISAATRDVLNLAFEVGDFVLHLEDDVLLAPDALRYFAWARDQYRDDPSVYTITGFGDRYFGPHDPQAVRRFQGFSSWSWATWRDRWEGLSRGWDLWEWDRGLKEHLRGDRVSVMPLLSRAKTIGDRGGVTNTVPHLEAWANDVRLDAQQPFYEVGEARVAVTRTAHRG